MSANSTAIPSGFKKCTKCHVVKLATAVNFRRSSSSKDSLSRQCKDCIRESERQRRLADPEKDRARKRRWRAEHQEDVRENERRYRRENPEIRRGAWLRWYQKQDPDSGPLRMGALRRRTRASGLPLLFTYEDRRLAFEYFHGYCAVCGQPLRDLFGERQPHLDHWIPVSDPRVDNPGGVPWNVVPLCSQCNCSKKDSDPKEWLLQRFGKRKANQIYRRIVIYLALAFRRLKQLPSESDLPDLYLVIDDDFYAI